MGRARLCVGWCALVLCMGTGERLAAAPILSLSSNTDLSRLSVGQPFTVAVSLTGLAPGQELVSLTSSVKFPSALLGAPSGTAAGPIVADPLDLLVSEADGLADGAFLPAGGGRISANGAFYTFNLTGQAAGSGVINFDLGALVAEQFNPAGEPLLLELGDGLLAGDGLAFTITIPEPGSIATGVLLTLAAGVRRRKASSP